MPVVNREDIRKIITAKVKTLLAAFPPLKGSGKPPESEFPGDPSIDMAKQVAPFVKVMIRYMDGEQVGLGTNAKYRPVGTLIVEVWRKLGTSVVEQNMLLDYLRPHLHMTDDLFPARLYAAKSATGDEKQGWQPETLIIPLWYDTNA